MSASMSVARAPCNPTRPGGWDSAGSCGILASLCFVLQRIGRFSGFFFKDLEGFYRMFCWGLLVLLEQFGIFQDYLEFLIDRISIRMFLIGWSVPKRIFQDLWSVFERFLNDIWNIFQDLWRVFERCLNDIWRIFQLLWNNFEAFLKRFSGFLRVPGWQDPRSYVPHRMERPQKDSLGSLKHFWRILEGFFSKRFDELG